MLKIEKTRGLLKILSLGLVMISFVKHAQRLKKHSVI